MRVRSFGFSVWSVLLWGPAKISVDCLVGPRYHRHHGIEGLYQARKATDERQVYRLITEECFWREGDPIRVGLEDGSFLEQGTRSPGCLRSWALW